MISPQTKSNRRWYFFPLPSTLMAFIYSSVWKAGLAKCTKTYRWMRLIGFSWYRLDMVEKILVQVSFLSSPWTQGTSLLLHFITMIFVLANGSEKTYGSKSMQSSCLVGLVFLHFCHCPENVMASDPERKMGDSCFRAAQTHLAYGLWPTVNCRHARKPS